MTMDEQKLSIIYQPSIFNVQKELKDRSHLLTLFRPPVPELNISYVLVPKDLGDCKIEAYQITPSTLTIGIELPDMSHTLDSIKTLSRQASDDFSMYLQNFFVNGEPTGTFNNLVGILSRHIMDKVTTFLNESSESLISQLQAKRDPKISIYFEALTSFAPILTNIYSKDQLTFQIQMAKNADVFNLRFNPTNRSITIVAPTFENAPTFIKNYIDIKNATKEQTFEFQKALLNHLAPIIENIVPFDTTFTIRKGNSDSFPIAQLLSVVASLGALSFLVLKIRK